MSIQLDSRTSSYLDAREIRPSDTSAVQATLQNAMAELSSALLTGAPIDPELVHFVIDYHNDSATGFADLRKFLYEDSPARVDYYLNPQKLGRPLTDALTPLIASGLFAPSAAARDTNLYLGLNNGKTLKATPPAEALSTLALATNVVPGSGTAVSGALLATTFAESYITAAAAAKQPLDMDVMDAYITINPAAAATFISNTLQGANAGYKPLLDVLRQLDPQAWAAKALAYLGSSVSLPLSKDNAALFQELSAIAPQATAEAAYNRLKVQMHEPGWPSLDAGLLAALGNYDKQRMTQVCTDRLNLAFSPPAKLEDLDVRPNDGIINHGTPAFQVNLAAMGQTAKVGDTLELYMDGAGLQHTITLTQADINAGTARIQLPASKAITGEKDLTVTLKDAVTGKTTYAPVVHVKVDTTGPSIVASGLTIYNAPWDRQWEGDKRWGYVQFDSDIDPTAFFAKVLVTGTSQEQSAYALPDMIFAAASKRIYFEIPRWLEPIVMDFGMFGYEKYDLDFSIQDTSGNSIHYQSTPLINYGNYVDWQLAKSTPLPPGPAPILPKLDHNAYQALKSVDPAAAAALYKQYNDAGRVGPAPAAAGPVQPPSGGTPLPGLTADDYGDLSIEALMKRVQLDRSFNMAADVNRHVTLIHSYNQMIANLQSLANEVAALDKLVKTDTSPTTLMRDVSPAPDDAAIGQRMNNLLSSAMPGFKLFEAVNVGHYNRDIVTYGGLKVAEKKIEAELSKINTAMQEAMNNMNSANNQRNAAMEDLNSFIKKIYDALDSIRRDG